MALSESLCWHVLKGCRGQVVSSKWFKGSETTDPNLENSLPLFVIERDLVLRHARQQIEDSLYFLEKRGYLIRHGFHGLTRVVYQLSEDALKILESGKFLPEEEQAFRESLLDIRQPGMWGLKFNLGEAWRRLNGRLDEPGVNKTGGRFRLPCAARCVQRGKTRTLGRTRTVRPP